MWYNLEKCFNQCGKSYFQKKNVVFHSDLKEILIQNSMLTFNQTKNVNQLLTLNDIFVFIAKGIH